MLWSDVYAEDDYNFIHTFQDKMYKWGYFTKVIEYDIIQLINNKKNDIFEILYAGRLIEYKHVEDILSAAAMLKQKGL